jgi:hypothetical protein
MLDPNSLIGAILAHNYPLLIAVVVGLLMAWLKAKIVAIDAKLPAALVPWLATAIMVGTTYSAAVIGGQPWASALSSAVTAALGSMLFHMNPTSIPTPSVAAARAMRVATAAKIAGCLVFLLALGACLSSAPIVPQTPQNANQIATCQTIAKDYNGVVVGDMVLSLGETGAGIAGAAISGSNPNAKTGFAVGDAIGAAAIASGIALAAYMNQDFTNSNCSSVVGALPPPPPLASSSPVVDAGWPDVSVTVVVSPEAAAPPVSVVEGGVQ